MHEDQLFQDAGNNLFQLARLNRQSMTEAETLLWRCLKGRKLMGHKFRRQHPFKRYIIDFYCPDSQLAIELDGEYHDDLKQKEYDEERTRELSDVGVQVIRFKNKDVVQNLPSVLQEISLHLRISPSRKKKTE
jgi:very-short-patch-repair endonuclease